MVVQCNLSSHHSSICPTPFEASLEGARIAGKHWRAYALVALLAVAAVVQSGLALGLATAALRAGLCAMRDKRRRTPASSAPCSLISHY